MAEGLRKAWDTSQNQAITAETVGWKTVNVALPPAESLHVEELKATLKPNDGILSAAMQLAWLQRCQAVT